MESEESKPNEEKLEKKVEHSYPKGFPVDEMPYKKDERPIDYVTRTRELFVKYTPNADTTPETLR